MNESRMSVLEQRITGLELVLDKFIEHAGYEWEIDEQGQPVFRETEFEINFEEEKEEE